jgi:hypothetical protein
MIVTSPTNDNVTFLYRQSIAKVTRRVGNLRLSGFQPGFDPDQKIPLHLQRLTATKGSRSGLATR